jgi:hypothetical protein
MSPAMRAALSADWPAFKAHHPVGAYLPVGQLDGDCRCGRGAWPCAVIVDALDAALAPVPFTPTPLAYTTPKDKT